jgi:hypothetical protein
VNLAARSLVVSVAVAALLPLRASRAEDFQKTLLYGVGLRVGGGYTIRDQLPDSVGLMVLDVRPYIVGQVAPALKFQGNLDLNNFDNGRIHVLDAVARFEPHDLFNVWFGRFLPPSDRANLSGPYFQNAWNYPTIVNAYPSIYAGRLDGAALWGEIGKGKLKYQGGVFTLDESPPIGQAIYAGRAVVNLLDPESGYYNSSTYYGAKDVLAIGGAVQYKKTVFRLIEQKFIAFNVDGLFEKRLGRSGDTVSLEGAYYNFDQGSSTGAGPPPLPPAPAPAVKQGSSFFALVSYLIGSKLGPGRVQPMGRWQRFMPNGGGGSTNAIDAGLNYIVDGHATRAALVMQHIESPGTNALTTVQFGIQIQE